MIADIPGPGGAPVRIRHARVDDAPALLDYLRAVGGESPYLTFGEEGPPLTEEEERAFLTRVETSDNAIALIAECNGQIVGSLTFSGGNRPRLRHIGEFGISVARAGQGFGIGRKLIELLIDWAERGGVVRKINLLVRSDNTRAIALYESFGFVIEGRIRREIIVGGEFFDSFIMGRVVDPPSS